MSGEDEGWTVVFLESTVVRRVFGPVRPWRVSLKEAQFTLLFGLGAYQRACRALVTSLALNIFFNN